MCVIFIGHQILADTPLLVLFNRDECWDRSTDPLHRWETTETTGEDLVAGQDRLMKGTWLAMHRPSGRFAALTNVQPLDDDDSTATTATADVTTPHQSGPNKKNHYHHGNSRKAVKQSRGSLVVDFCISNEPVETYRETVLAGTATLYDGYNLIYGTIATGFFYYSNRFAPQKLQPGVLYGLTNGTLDDAWPKVQRGKNLLQQLLLEQHRGKEGEEKHDGRTDMMISDDELFTILKDDWKPTVFDNYDNRHLPDKHKNNNQTGAEPQKQELSFGQTLFRTGIFLPNGDSHLYGTRSSTIVRVTATGVDQDDDRCPGHYHVKVTERTFCRDASNNHTSYSLVEWVLCSSSSSSSSM
jgi:uncharacterized protein with NRDE domain